MALLLTFLASTAMAAPFAKKIQFVQQDGTAIELWGEGDEFYAVFETLDGYTVMFDRSVKAYYYALLSPSGNELVSSGVLVGKGDPTTLGVTPHLRINRDAMKKQVKERFHAWDQEMGITAQWNQLKAMRRQEDADKNESVALAPPSFTTTGTKVGLTILVDFSDSPKTISQADIINFCNSDNYTG